jgi:hypothetical protein
MRASRRALSLVRWDCDDGDLRVNTGCGMEL